MASASQGQVEFSADPTNVSSFMKFHEATRSFALPVGSHGVPLDPRRARRPPPSAPKTSLHTRRAPPTAARGPVAPPETVSQVRTRSTEPHGPHLRPSAGTRGPVRREVGGRRAEPNAASVHTRRAGPTAPRACPGCDARTRQVRTAVPREPHHAVPRSPVNGAFATVPGFAFVCGWPEARSTARGWACPAGRC